MKNHKLNLLLVNAFLVVNILIYILIPFVNVSFVKNPVTISIYCVGLAGMAILEIFLSKEYKRIPADKETDQRAAGRGRIHKLCQAVRVCRKIT